MYTTNTAQIVYNLAEPDKYALNISLNYNQYNTPNYGSNQLAKETSMPDLYLYNKRTNKMRTPSLDIYWSVVREVGQRLRRIKSGTVNYCDIRLLN